MKHTAVRKHEIHCGHRVYGHEGKCQHLHGHSYVFEFHCQAKELDTIGRVLDFGVMKSKLCQWLEENWDHRMLMWDKDPLALYVLDIDNSTVLLPVNPTAENLAEHLLYQTPKLLAGTGVECVKIIVHETGKCYASCE